MGVVGGFEKFNHFTFGRPVTVLTDHKPLIAISKKSLVNAPPRLQHLLLRLNSYNHLSCNVPSEKLIKPMCEGLDLKIHDVYLNMSPEKCVSLEEQTCKDLVLSSLKNQIIKGWPPNRSECPKDLQDFWNYQG